MDQSKTNYPGSIEELLTQFATDKDCREWLVKSRWPDGFICPRCAHNRQRPARGLLRECVRCGLQVSATARTLFDKTRIPLPTWFQVLWWTAQQKELVSALDLQHVFGLSNYETAWKWLQKIRYTMWRGGGPPLSGRVKLSYFSFSDTTPVPGVAVAMNRRLRASVIRQLTDSEITRFIANNTYRPAKLLMLSDTDLAKMPMNGVKIDRLGKAGAKLFKDADLFAQAVRRWLATPHGRSVGETHLDLYLAELTFRFNHRKVTDSGKRFSALMQMALDVPSGNAGRLVEEESGTDATEKNEKDNGAPGAAGRS